MLLSSTLVAVRAFTVSGAFASVETVIASDEVPIVEPFAAVTLIS